MKNNVIALSPFSIAYKRFLKKFPNLKKEFTELEKTLTAEPKTGESLGGWIV